MGNTVTIDEQVFTDIADAIRDRNGETATYKPREMAAAVEDLHNVRVKKWVRPSDWPDYSKVDLTGQEVIYLTYDCTYENRWCSVKVSGAYTIERGSLNNGVFTSVDSSNQTSESTFQQLLPTNEGDYVVYRITPQEGVHITSFRFAQIADSDSSATFYSHIVNPCVERYARLPNMTGTWSWSGNVESWSTRYLVADTIEGAVPTNLSGIYNNSASVLQYIDYSKCSFANVTTFQNAFYNQYNLAECHLPHDVSNKCINLQGVFQNCYRLVYLDLSDWDTSNVTMFANMFYNSGDLIEIKGIDNFVLTSATSLANFFSGAGSLNELDTSKWATTSVLTNMSSCFAGMSQIKSLDLSGFDTTNVTTFASCFSGCRSIKTIDISSFTISSKVTALNGMFAYMRVLENLIRNKDWDTSNVISFEGMFRECKCLKEIDLSDFDFSKATTVRYMFMQCNSLRKIKGTINLPLITNKANVTDFATNCWMLEDLSEMSITNSTYMLGFGYDYSILHFRMPVVSTLADNCLRDMNHCRVFDFRDYTSVPTLNTATDITNGMNNYLIIVVPYDLFDAWVSATNWSNVLLRNNIITEDDYDYYVNPSSTFTNIDLSQYTWSKCSGSNLSAADGVVYSSTITTTAGTGPMVTTTAPIELPANTTVYININDGYQYRLFYFDSNEKHIKVTNKDNFKSWFFVSNSAVGSIGLVISKTDGSNIAPEDWADSGITVFYQRKE